MYLPLLTTAFLLIGGSLLATDQAGAEKTKIPVAAKIVNVVAVPPGSADVIGNVQVTYSDGTKDLWTTKRDASLPHVAPDGTVGWTVNGPETQIAASYTLRPNGNLVLCHLGKVVARIRSGKGFIEEWDFVNNGQQLVLKTRAAHGPATIELHETATGALVNSVGATEENLPGWAAPYHE